MTWIISDANIIIDMEVADILDKMFCLPDSFAVPNILYAEELERRHPHLPALGLAVLDVLEEFVLEAYRLGGVYKRASHNDLLALSLAKQESAPLLTGDARLREAAEMEGVEIRGTLWLMDRLFAEKILDYQSIHDAYEKMRQEARRLPWDKVKRQLQAMGAK